MTSKLVGSSDVTSGERTQDEVRPLSGYTVPVAVPDRYRRFKAEEHRLACTEAPTMTVHLERGYCASASAVKGSKPGTIYLDGAGAGPPMIDTEREVINLDHHDDCVRPFTLSTCEQAFVLVAKGFDFDTRDWRIYANEPDLDTLLALWVLLNHRRLKSASPQLLSHLVPLLKVEGAIDVHGLDGRKLTGYPEAEEERLYLELEEIGAIERELKSTGEWATVDYVEYTVDRLRALDRLLYEPGDFDGRSGLEEIARAELPGGNLVIACRSGSSIYQVEKDMAGVYGDRLALLVLEKLPGTYTLRQVAAFSKHNLARVYDWLNLLDRNAGNSKSGERWGGSEEIGGSPRSAGSALRVRRIAAAAAEALTKPGPMERLRGWSRPLLAALAVCTLGALLVERVPGSAVPTAAMAVAATLFWSLLIDRPGLSGTRLPVFRTEQIASALLVLLGALCGGLWIPTPNPIVGTNVWATAILFALGSELMLRGLMIGRVAETERGLRSPWRGLPVITAAIFWAVWLAIWSRLEGAETTVLSQLVGGIDHLASPLGALLVGLGLGHLRVSSESLLTPVAVHVALVAALLFVT